MATYSVPLATLFHGDVTIEYGCDTASYGYGDLKVYRQGHIGIGNSTESINASTGSLVVYGGLGVTANSNLRGILTVSSTSNLQTTYIDTSLGVFSVSGGNAMTVSVNDTISLTSTNIVSLNSSLNTKNAIQLNATNNLGGITLSSGQNSGVNISAGSLGIVGSSVLGPISLTANGGSGAFIVNALNDNQNLTLQINNNYNSGILIESAGTNFSIPALHFNTTYNTGNIYITNNSNGNSAGQINLFGGSSGINITSNTGGQINIIARDAASSFVINTVSDANDLTIGINGTTNSSLILHSEGTGTDAILLETTNASGYILVQQATGSGGVNINTGSGGLNTITQNGGGINLTANGASSSFINQTTADNQDLTICVRGDTDSSLILCSDGKANDAIQINANTGGINVFAAGTISINTSNTSSGINIGTLNNVPVTIGTSTSTTTIKGNLDVQGTTTTYDSTIVQIADNIIQINNGPSGTADGGIAVKRWQSANDNCSGDVISDTPEITGTVSNINSTEIVITSPSTPFSPDTGYYRGYWVTVRYGSVCHVRRVKNWIGNASGGTLTIFSTVDQDTVLGSPTPVEGLDLPNITVTNATFGLYPCHWVVSMWNEFEKEYSLVCSNFVSGDNDLNSSSIPIAHYINLHVNNIIANALTINSINGTTADIQLSVTLNHDTVPRDITNGHYYPNYGVFIVLVKPTIETGTSPYAVFVIGRRNDPTNCGQVARIISVKGTNGEMLDMAWPTNSYPTIFYRPSPGTAGSTDYTVKLISV